MDEIRFKVIESDAVDGVLIIGGLRPGHKPKVTTYPNGRHVAGCSCGGIAQGFTGLFADLAASAAAYAHAVSAAKIVT